jgi:hypothetical protein
MMRGRGLQALLAAIAGLIVWAIHFIVVYGAQATACVRGAVAERSIVVMVLVVSALALLALLALLLRARSLMRRGPQDGAAGDSLDWFMPRVAMGVTLVALLAVVWETAPAFVLPACG